MNKINNCDILKDLAISYKENLLSTGSKEFIEQHLSECNNCQKYYKNINSEILENNTNKEYKDTIMANGLKKVSRRISILKLGLSAILISILIISSIFFFRFKKTNELINASYNQIQYMKNLDNYKLTVKTIQKNLMNGDIREYEKNYYYKNGKYKIEDNDSIKFYADDSYEKICAYPSLKSIQYYKQNFIEVKKGTMIDIFPDVITLKNSNSIFYDLSLSIREERYNGVDCFIIRFGNKNSYRDIWINKANHMVIRIINEDYMNFYNEEIYTLYENVVNDNDIDTSILNSDEYINYDKKYITNNATEEMELYYELYNK